MKIHCFFNEHSMFLYTSGQVKTMNFHWFVNFTRQWKFIEVRWFMNFHCFERVKTKQWIFIDKNNEFSLIKHWIFIDVTKTLKNHCLYHVPSEALRGQTPISSSSQAREVGRGTRTLAGRMWPKIHDRELNLRAERD